MPPRDPHVDPRSICGSTSVSLPCSAGWPQLPYCLIFALYEGFCLMVPYASIRVPYIWLFEAKINDKNALLPYMSTSGRVNSIFGLFWVLFKTKTV